MRDCVQFAPGLCMDSFLFFGALYVIIFIKANINNAKWKCGVTEMNKWMNKNAECVVGWTGLSIMDCRAKWQHVSEGMTQSRGRAWETRAACAGAEAKGKWDLMDEEELKEKWEDF